MVMSVDREGGVVACQCDHLTNFGVLVVSHLHVYVVRLSSAYI